MTMSSGLFSPAMRELRLFLGASFSNRMAEPFLRFGVAWHVLQNTDSMALFAAVYGISSLLEALARPFLAPISDHFNRITVFRFCSVVSAAMCLALVASVLFLPFSLALIAAILTGSSLVAGLSDPTEQAIFPHLVGPDEMTKAASMRGMFMSLSSMSGPVLAGAVLALTNAEVTLGASAFMELTAVALAFVVRRNASLDAIVVASGWSGFRRVWHLRVAEGMRSLCLNRAERTVCLTTTLIHSVYVAIVAIILPVWAMKQLGGSASAMAQMEFSLGLGMLLGSTVVLTRANALVGRYVASIVAPALAGLALLSANLFDMRLATLVCLAVVGAGFSVYFINTGAVRAAATPAHFRSRLLGAFGFIVGIGGPVLMQFSGSALDYLSVTSVNGLCAAVLLVGAVVHARNRDTRFLMKQADESIAGRYETMYPAAFVERDSNTSTTRAT